MRKGVGGDKGTLSQKLEGGSQFPNIPTEEQWLP